MLPETDSPVTETSTEPDRVTAIRRALEASSEPLTLSKIRAQLPLALRSISLDDLAAILQRQTTAGVLIQYPKYRSQQDRFWDRPMTIHLAQLIRTTLEEGPLTISELRRKLPGYAKPQVDAIVEGEIAKGMLYRHPVVSGRGGPRLSTRAPEPKDFLRTELSELFRRLEQLGFSRAQLRQGALELLHEEEWETPAPMTGLRHDAPHSGTGHPPHEAGVSTTTPVTHEPV